MQLVVIIILVIIVLILMVYNYSVHKKIDSFTNLNQRITSLNVLQEFMNTLAEDISVDNKLETINDTLINKYSIKYSTIVVYNGAEYVVKASNVDKKHWNVLTNLQSDPIFGESIEKATPKYITVETEAEKLPYQKSEFGRAKCAMFFPLYIDNLYIGYWIIEGSVPHEFDKIDTTILEVVRNNIVTMLKTVEYQSTIENIVRDDKYSGLKSVEYIYGGIGKKTIDQHVKSTIAMFRITNIEEVNEKVSRKTGNNLISIVSNEIAKGLAAEYVFVRYMGPKFVIVFSGVDKEGVVNYLKMIKPKIENLVINIADDYKGEVLPIVKPKLRFAVSVYYKGTLIEGNLRRLENFIDKSPENTITIL